MVHGPFAAKGARLRLPMSTVSMSMLQKAGYGRDDHYCIFYKYIYIYADHLHIHGFSIRLFPADINIVYVTLSLINCLQDDHELQ